MIPFAIITQYLFYTKIFLNVKKIIFFKKLPKQLPIIKNKKEKKRRNKLYEISNIANDSYIKPMMQRYHFIAKITNYSRETIRQILNGTRTYMYYKKRKYSFKIFITIQIFGIQIGNFTFQKHLNI